MEGILRVVTLNIGSLLEPDWERRRHETVAWIDELEPDVVCLQEVWEDSTHPNTAGWIARHCAVDWHMAFGGDPLDASLWPDPTMRFGSAILSRWPIEDTSHIRLPVNPDAHRGEFVHAVPWELLGVRTAGLDVFSTHLAAAPHHGNHRQLQVVAVDGHVRSVRGDADVSPPPGGARAGMPAILCGDLNAEPDSDEIRFLSSLHTIGGRSTFWQDSWRMAGEGPGHTQDWRTNPIAASMNVNRKRIDYIFVGDPFGREGGAGRVLSARVVFDEPRTGVLASDHFGVTADIVWPTRPT